MNLRLTQISVFAFVFVLFVNGASAANRLQHKKAKSLANYIMGVLHDFDGLDEQAVEDYEKSIRIEDNSAAHLRLGANYARAGRLFDAKEQLKKVVRLEPKNIQAHYLLALIYSTEKNFDKAADEYESILNSFDKVDLGNLEIYGYLGQLYYSQKNYEKAIKQFETILSVDKDNSYVIFLLGSLYLELNQTDKAIKMFSKALLLDPLNDFCLNSLGYLYAEQGMNLDEAQDLIERALTLDPDNGAYLDSLGWVYYQKGDYRTALSYLLKADRMMKDPVIYEHLGDVYLKLDQKDNAEKYWSLSLDLLPGQQSVMEKIQTLESM